MTKRRNDPGLAAAIVVAGSVKRLAKLLGLTSPAVSMWQRVPGDRVLAVEAATGVSRYKLRPDLHGTRRPPPSN